MRSGNFGIYGFLLILGWFILIIIVRFVISIYKKNNTTTPLPAIDTDKKQFIKPTILAVVSILVLILFAFNFFSSF